MGSRIGATHMETDLHNEAAGERAGSEALALQAICQVLRHAGRVLVTMHCWPDGDALGSALGLASALEEAGKAAAVYNPQGVPESFRFLPGADRVLRGLPAEARFDATVVCDAGDLSRLGADLPGPDRRGVFVNLDHHLTTPRFGDLNLVDPAAASVGVLVHRVVRAAPLPLSRATATALYVSLLTDTGSFRYSNTNPEAMRVAAELIEAGAEPWEIARRVYETQKPERLRLLALALGTLQLGFGGKLASLTVTQAMCREAGTGEETAEGFVTFPRSIEGVEVAALFREDAPGAWKVSLRSRGRVDVSAVAQALGGGGHHNASGCSLQGELGQVRRKLLAAIEAALPG